MKRVWFLVLTTMDRKQIQTSLLGETTAETKLALNKLKNSLAMDDKDGWH